MSLKSLISFSKFIVFFSFSASALCVALYFVLPDMPINDGSLTMTILVALVINLCISYLALYFHQLLKKKLVEEQKVEQEFLVDPLTGETKTYRV